MTAGNQGAKLDGDAKRDECAKLDAPKLDAPKLDGWLILDKPLGMSSGRAVGIVRRMTRAKIGHAGTLDPLATGVLPLALGEATKTVSFAMGGAKLYRFGVRWGEARSTDDREGEIVALSDRRPDRQAIEAALPGFTGTVQQVPPVFSAIHVDGRRAYALARANAAPILPPRPVEIHTLALVDQPDPDHAVFEARVGKGTYIRSLARDLALALGTVGHVATLRRLSVGPFTEAQAIPLDSLVALGHNFAASGHLLSIETVLDDIPALALSAEEAARMRHGQTVTPIDPGSRALLERLADDTIVSLRSQESVVALARVENGALRPVRVFNL